jgi:hypothetical protein
MLRRIVNLVVTSVLKTVQDRAVGHITLVELELTPTLPQGSLSDVTCCTSGCQLQLLYS